MSSAPITFSGSSTFSSSFQQVIARAVGIASLPLQELQTSVSTLSSQQAALSGLYANFGGLQSAVQALSSAKNGSVTAQVSTASVLTAIATSTALPGTYTIQVDDPGSSTNTVSQAGLTTVTDPFSQDITSASAFTLTVNGTTHSISNSGNSLESLANAINTAAAGVQATLVNLGSASSPDYRLAIASSNLGADSIQLNDGSKDLLDTVATGTNAQYKVNGSATAIQTTSRQVALSPGLTINLLTQSASPVTITVSKNYNGVQAALSNLANSYNSATDALAQHRGERGGALTGDSLVFALTNVLQRLSQYTSGSGPVGSLADLGLTLDETGHINFNLAALSSNTTAITQFLGDVSSGGFLKAVNDDLSSVTDSTTGLISSNISSMQSRITADYKKIADQQSRIDGMQANLQAQLAQADAAIATLQAQKTYFQELFKATYGNGSNGN